MIAWHLTWCAWSSIDIYLLSLYWRLGKEYRQLIFTKMISQMTQTYADADADITIWTPDADASISKYWRRLEYLLEDVLYHFNQFCR